MCFSSGQWGVMMLQRKVLKPYNSKSTIVNLGAKLIVLDIKA